MNSHIFSLAIQITMLAGLLSIVFLLIMPAIPFFNNKDAHIEKRSVLEISNSLTGTQQLIISRAKKLLEKQSDALIEVVATGKGISLLFHNTSFKEDIQSLINKGVVFTVCQFSLQQLENRLGHPVELLPRVRLIADGHSYAEGLKESGYIDELA